jgi:type I restriction enzyme S subunit
MAFAMKKWCDVLQIISGKNQKGVASVDGKYLIYGSGGVMGRADDYLCEAGTTIVGRKGTINNPIFVAEPFWNVDTAFGITPGQELQPKFLYYFCCFYNFKALDKSTTIPSLAKRDLLNIEMPVPSLPEQERIVARIEELFSELDKAVETLNTTKQQLVVYRQAVLREAFADHMRWEKYQFADLMSAVRNGYGAKPDDAGEYRILRISSVRPMKLDLSDYRLNRSQFSVEDTICENDLLFTRYNGSKEYVGVCAAVPAMPCSYAYPDKLIKCTPKVQNQIHSKFLQFYLNQGEARKYIRSKIKTTSGQNGISGSDIKKTIIYLPNLTMQETVVSKIESRLSVCDSIEQAVDTALQQAEAMRQSILKQAFEGEL